MMISSAAHKPAFRKPGGKKGIDVLHLGYARRQILSVGVLTLLASLLYFNPSFPYSHKLCAVTLLSSLLHLFFFIFFDRIFPRYPHALRILSAANVLLMNFIIHFTGGIASPFTFLYFGIFASEASYEIKRSFGIPLAIASYAALIGAEFLGILSPVHVTSHDIYASPLTTLIIALAMMISMIIAGIISRKIMRNLSETLTAEQLKAELFQKRLSELDAPSQMGIVAHRIVHDLRGPLTAMAGYLELIGRKLSGDSDEAHLQKIVCDEITRVSKLVDSLARYGRPHEKGKAALCPVEILESVISIISFYPGANKITFERKFPEKSSLRVYANKDELQQAYFNLLKNAIEALLAKPLPPRIIEVGIKASGTMAEISISDNGPGIAPDILPAVMQKPASGKANGTGVGLLITKDIFEQNHGSIEIRNKEGSGAIIITKVPLYK